MSSCILIIFKHEDNIDSSSPPDLLPNLRGPSQIRLHGIPLALHWRQRLHGLHDFRYRRHYQHLRQLHLSLLDFRQPQQQTPPQGREQRNHQLLHLQSKRSHWKMEIARTSFRKRSPRLRRQQTIFRTNDLNGLTFQGHFYRVAVNFLYYFQMKRSFCLIFLALICCELSAWPILQQSDLVYSVWRSFSGSKYQFTAQLDFNGTVNVIMTSSAYPTPLEVTWKFDLNLKVLTLFNAAGSPIVNFIYSFRDRYTKWRLYGKNLLSSKYDFYTLEQLI